MPSTVKSLPADTGVSVVIPVRNGRPWITEVVAAIARDCGRRPHEILLVDDGGTDDSVAACRQIGVPHLRVVSGPGRGAAAAVNAGLAEARFPFVAQIDQDVIVDAGWLDALLSKMEETSVAAAQGWYTRDSEASPLARMMAMDLEQRYFAIPRGHTDHVCTGNVLWRRDAVAGIGGLDESLGYGYDNDLSYRLIAAGHTLVISRRARSRPCWREGLWGYLRQQYGFGYGRLDLVWRHPSRLAGDDVSPSMMMAHPLVMGLALAAFGMAGVSAAAGRPTAPWVASGVILAAGLIIERAVASLRAYRRWYDEAALLFPVVHLLRDAAWVLAVLAWVTRRATRRSARPSHSMRTRSASASLAVGPAEDR